MSVIIYKRGSKSPVVGQIQAALHLIQDNYYGPLTEEAVRLFQMKNGLTPDGVVGPKTLALLLRERLKKSKRTITEIIVHCSATPEGKNYTVDDIRRWHTTPVAKGGRGWSDIGYHYVIHLDGSVHVGRDVDIAGAHATDHNAHSIGVCYVGGCSADGKTPKDTRNESQKNALLNLLMELKRIYPSAIILSHRDCRMRNGKQPNKACPSFDASREYSRI